MWNKEQGAPGQPTVASASNPEAPRAPVTRSTGHATIGPSIVVRGEVSGNEDLLIQGQLDGSVTLDLHSVTVGSGGRVKADITGRIITIEGNVEGNLNAKEQIILRGSAIVQGDIKAPAWCWRTGPASAVSSTWGCATWRTRPNHAKRMVARRPLPLRRRLRSRRAFPQEHRPAARRARDRRKAAHKSRCAGTR